MAEGTLITESLRVGTDLGGLRLTVNRIQREEADLSPEQVANGLSRVWTVLDFEVSDDEAASFAEALSRNLGRFGWYANLQSVSESFIVFSGRVFRFRRGDPGGRAEAQAYARQLGVPEPQLQWTV